MKKVDEYKNAVDNSSEYIIDLIIVFIFQTILLPIVFIYILYVLIKKCFIILDKTFYTIISLWIC